MSRSEEPDRVPIICGDESVLVCANLFDPNSWSGRSRGIVQSCWTESSVLHHCVRQLTEMCGAAEQLCAKHIDAIQEQWSVAEFEVRKVKIFGQVPDLHMRIEAFFSGVKTLLDLLVQLLASEHVVNRAVHGFHRDKNTYGGSVLKALTHNASSARKEVAAKALVLLSEHKSEWIDQTISARDLLIHPGESAHQLMFRLGFTVQERRLVCTSVSPPAIGSETIDRYAERVFGQAQTFSSAFLGLFK